MDSKAIIGLIASLGVMGAVITQSSNKAKDAESFMADMTGHRPSGSKWNAGKGVRKIPPKKLNFTAFDKDLPPFISKKMKQDWDKLASLTPADWQNIGEVMGRNTSCSRKG